MNVKTLIIFISSLSLFILSLIIWDIYIYVKIGSVSSISWTMSLMGKYPFFVFVIGHVSGAIVWGLAAHFWTRMISPDDYAELISNRAEIIALKAQLSKETQDI